MRPGHNQGGRITMKAKLLRMREGTIERVKARGERDFPCLVTLKGSRKSRETGSSKNLKRTSPHFFVRITLEAVH